MKRILSIFLVLCMIMTLLPMTALASLAEYVAPASVTAKNIVMGTGYEYNTETKELTITSNDGAKYGAEWRTAYVNEIVSIIVGDEVTQIDTNTIYNIPKLSSVHIGEGVSKLVLSNNIFISCPNLSTVTVAEGNTTYKAVDNVIFSKDGKKLIRYPEGKKDENYVIPNDVEILENRAFFYNKHVDSVSIPVNVTIIPAEAFYGCSNLREITLGKVEEIGVQAFSGCSKLTEIDLPSTMTKIGFQAFLSCSKLEAIKIPAGVTSIGSSAFAYCTKLKDIIMDPRLAPVIEINDLYSNKGLFSTDMNPNIYTPINSEGYTVENGWTLGQVIEGRAALSGLILGNATLSSAFSPNVTSYTAIVPYSVTTISVKPIIGLGTSVTVNGRSVASGSSSTISLDVGENTFTLLVSNLEYPDEAKTYTLVVTRENVNISVGNLSVLVTPGNGKVILAPQAPELGCTYYYKTTAVDDSSAKPEYASDVFNPAGWTSFDAETDITSPSTDEIFVQVVKVRDEDSKIYGWGQASAAPYRTYTISGTITGSDTLSGIAATVQLKNSSNENVGSPVIADLDGTYTINDVPVANGYTIEVSCIGYDSGTIASFDVTTDNIRGKDLSLVKTVVFKPVTEISGVAITGIVGTDVVLRGVVIPSDATNKAIVWSLGEGSTAANAMVSDGKASATGAGRVVVKATINNGATASTDYIQEFVITFSEAPPIIYTVTFDTNGGTRTGGGELTQNVAYGESAVAPILTRKGYKFSGWDKPLTNITMTQTITAQWTAKSTGGNKDDGKDSESNVGNKEELPSLVDIASHWAKEDIEFVISQGLFSGTSETNFSPDMAMTRGMFVTVLGRMAKADVSGYKEISFTDVKEDAYYMGYIEWARLNKIIKGIGNGIFAPDKSITREQMAVILANYAKAMGLKLPEVNGEKTFADSDKISAYAKDAVEQMQILGIISGKGGNIFDPQGEATRAEISVVLRRFVELISSETDTY